MTNHTPASLPLFAIVLVLGASCFSPPELQHNAEGALGPGVSAPLGYSELQTLPVQELAAQVGAQYAVPGDLLLALSWESSSLSPVHGGHGECSPMMGWMGLSPDQIAQAASLTGLDVERIEGELAASFVAAAALLANNRTQLAPDAGMELDARWWSVIEHWPTLGERWLDQEFALAVFDVLQRGLETRAANGDPVSLSAHQLPGLADVELLAPPSNSVGRDVAAYGYDGASRFVPASPANYSSRPSGIDSIDQVVIHTTEGSYDGAISWFRDASSEVSAHYVIRKSDGEVTQMVSDHQRAWHAGPANGRSIGIEHEGALINASTWTAPLLESSARLSAWLSETYEIPIDRAHFIAHSEVAGSNHADPGPHFPWSTYLEMVTCFRYGGSSCGEAGTSDSDPVDDPASSGAGSGSGTGSGSGSGSSGGSCGGSCGGASSGDSGGSPDDGGTSGIESASVRFVEPRTGDEVSNPVVMRAERNGGPWVEFWAGAFRIGSPIGDNPAHASAEFFLTGERTLTARLYSNSGVLLDTDTVVVTVRRTHGEMAVWPSVISTLEWLFEADVLDVVGEVDYVTFSVDGELIEDEEAGSERVSGPDFDLLHRFSSDPNGSIVVARAFDSSDRLLGNASAVLDGDASSTPHCAVVGTLRCGDVISADTERAPEAGNNLDAYPEIPGNFSGPELGYHLDFGAASRVELTLVDPRPTEINHDLILLDAGSGFCFADAFVDRGFNDLEFEPEGSRSYILVVDGYAGDAGAFELAMDCH